MSYLGWLPVALVLVSAAGFVISYIIAIAKGDVAPAFPYISDSGIYAPERCIFGELLNFSAFLAFCTMFVRYKMIVALAGNEDPWLCKVNRVAMLLGCVSALGCSLVANFQEGTVVEPVHIAGAALTFFGGVIYCFLQTAMSYHMYPGYNGLTICRIRLAITVISLCSLIITVIAAAVALKDWKDFGYRNKDKYKWKPDQPGYAAHIVSTVGEWMTALTFLGFFFTYVRELHKFDLEVHIRPLVRHLDEEPIEGFPNERTRLLP